MALKLVRSHADGSSASFNRLLTALPPPVAFIASATLAMYTENPQLVVSCLLPQFVAMTRGILNLDVPRATRNATIDAMTNEELRAELYARRKVARRRKR
jgi:hypothetical protein